MTDDRTPPGGGDEPSLDQPSGPPPDLDDATLVHPPVPPPSGAMDPTLVQPATPGGPPPPVPPASPPPGDTPWWRRSWAILLWVLLGALLAFALTSIFSGDDAPTTSTTGVPGTTSATTTTAGGETTTSGAASTTTSPPTTTTTTTAAPTTTTTAPPTTTTTAPPEALFSDGVHVVGEDVQPGVYETGMLDPGLPACTWQRLTEDDVEVLGLVDTHGIVEVVAGDATLTTDACGDWYALFSLPEPLDEIAPGAWAVGPHVSVGRWAAPGGDECVWARLSAFTGEPDAVIDQGESTGAVIVDIEDDDVGFTSTGCGTWTSS